MSEPTRKGWTSHGHPIPGVTNTSPRPNRVARCGGTMLCSECKSEALQTQPTVYEGGGWLTDEVSVIENTSGKPEPIFDGTAWARLVKREPHSPIVVTTEANTPDAFNEAATQALTQSNGAPLKLEGIHQHVAPDKYEGGYKTGYAWTFTPLD